MKFEVNLRNTNVTLMIFCRVWDWNHPCHLVSHGNNIQHSPHCQPAGLHWPHCQRCGTTHTKSPNSKQLWLNFVHSPFKLKGHPPPAHWMTKNYPTLQLAQRGVGMIDNNIIRLNYLQLIPKAADNRKQQLLDILTCHHPTFLCLYLYLYSTWDNRSKMEYSPQKINEVQTEVD